MKIEGLVVIYKITNPQGKIYIGQTQDWVKRMRDYKNGKQLKQYLINRSILKYGWENHKVELLQYFQLSEVDDAEIKFIKDYNSYYKNNLNGLNMTYGGIAPMRGKLGEDNPRFGAKATEEARKNMSLAQIGKKRSKEAILKGALTRTGKKASFESIAKRVEKSLVRVLQYDLYGNFLKEWRSLNEVEKQLKIGSGNLWSCLNKRKNYNQAGGFQWRYFEENYPLKIEKANVKNLIQFKVTNLKTNLIEVVEGLLQLREKYKIKQDSLHNALTYKNGFMKRTGLHIEIIQSQSNSNT